MKNGFRVLFPPKGRKHPFTPTKKLLCFIPSTFSPGLQTVHQTAFLKKHLFIYTEKFTLLLVDRLNGGQAVIYMYLNEKSTSSTFYYHLLLDPISVALLNFSQIFCQENYNRKLLCCQTQSLVIFGLDFYNIIKIFIV